MESIYIIAEAGVNHNGDPVIAKRMIECAAECSVDAVKFQTFRADSLVVKNAEKAEYQKKTTDLNETQYQMIKNLELSSEVFKELFNICGQNNIDFVSSPFDIESIDILVHLGVKIIKVPSGEITNLPYLRKIGRLQKRVILSTGMADINEVGAALDILVQAGTSKEYITVLHCTTEYPAPVEEVNLRAMLTMRDVFDVSVGYSDHTTGIEIPIAAATIGATVIEKHFTLNKMLPGPDHRASLEPSELKQMVQAIRNIEKSLGNGIKTPSPSELKNISVVRKSIVAARNIQKGELFNENNITVKRPGTGLSPMAWDKIIGTKAVRDYHTDEMIKP